MPTSVQEDSVFILDQKRSKLKHIYDVEADDTPGAKIKREQLRFYQVNINQEDDTMDISTEVTVQKDHKGHVTRGTFNMRNGKSFEKQAVRINDLYALIRRRATSKSWKEKHSIKFVRNVLYIMHIEEYNKHHSSLREYKSYTLEQNRLTLQYKMDTEIKCLSTDEGFEHGNRKNGTSEFRPTMHSVKRELMLDARPARVIIDDFEKDNELFDRATEACVPRNSKQVYNFQQKLKKDPTPNNAMTLMQF